jgi:hypothetical protein
MIFCFLFLTGGLAAPPPTPPLFLSYTKSGWIVAITNLL